MPIDCTDNPLPIAARFSSSFSTFIAATDMETAFLHWLEIEYLSILAKHGYHIIYGATEETARILFKDGGFWKRVHNVTDSFIHNRRHSAGEIWMDRSQYISLGVVSQLFVLSERSIERLIRLKWSSDEETQVWETDDFSATFEPLRIRLLSNGKIVVVVYIKHAELKPASQYVRPFNCHFFSP